MAKPTSFSSIILNLTSLGITGGQLYLNGQSSLVYNTGAQNISGIKTYYDRPNFLSGLNLSGKTLTATGSNLYLNGTGILDSTIVRTTGDQIISGVKTFSYVIAENIANNSEQQIVNLTDGFLKRIGGALSIDWKNQIAYDQGEDISINWNNKKLYSTGYQRVDWSSGILYSLYAGGEMATVNWMSGLLYSSANGASTIDWTNKKLKSAGTDRIIWGNNAALNDEVGSPAITFTSSSKNLYNTTGGISISYDYSLGWNDNGSISIWWGDNALSGNWKTNTNPTDNSHIINKGYLETGNFVRTTGTQTILGTKSFSGGIIRTYDQVFINGILSLGNTASYFSNDGILYKFPFTKNYDTQNRKFYAGVGDLSIDYDNRQLSGVWSVLNSPIGSDSIVNKSFLQTGDFLLTGSAPSNTGTPAAWAVVVMSGVSYKTPLYL